MTINEDKSITPNNCYNNCMQTSHIFNLLTLTLETVQLATASFLFPGNAHTDQIYTLNAV